MQSIKTSDQNNRTKTKWEERIDDDIIAFNSAACGARWDGSLGCDADAVLSKPCQLDTLISAARLFVRDLGSPADAAGRHAPPLVPH